MFFKQDKPKNIRFSDLPAGQQKRILIKSVKQANQDQLELVKRFDLLKKSAS